MSSRSLRGIDLRGVDRCARQLILAVEPDLRAHLGSALLDSGLIADLYIRLRELLAAHVKDAAAAGSRRDLAEELALTLYLVVSTRQPEGEVKPDLLVSLQESLLAALGAERDRFGGVVAPCVDPEEPQPETAAEQRKRLPSRRRDP